MAKKCEYCGTAFISAGNFCQACGAPRNTVIEEEPAAEKEKTETTETKSYTETTTTGYTETGSAESEENTVPTFTDTLKNLGSNLSSSTKKAATVGGSLLGALLLGNTLKKTRNTAPKRSLFSSMTGRQNQYQPPEPQRPPEMPMRHDRMPMSRPGSMGSGQSVPFHRSSVPGRSTMRHHQAVQSRAGSHPGGMNHGGRGGKGPMGGPGGRR